ncbi:MAG TPA: tetratricopeptide repeat protein [Thermoanaerobaculia bacterium]|jgi:tetratricopeptide (TPR) repeat protein|nr:tetratricopeptide repeat protein [Thermoanaerobaculia bacterium]
MPRTRLASLLLAVTLAFPTLAADHNDPNSVNSIFSDVDVSAADLYDMFGWPSDDGNDVILALTFASIPRAGVFDTDMLYRIEVVASPRPARPLPGDPQLEGLLSYAEAVKEKYLHLHGAEVRVKVDEAQQAHVDFIGFPSGTFSRVLPLNQALTVTAPDGSILQVYIGGRDDAFFNDLPGFFRSINYAPQFYHVPLGAPKEQRELMIPKTLLELEGNTLFNFNPAKPLLGAGVKEDFPAAGRTLTPTRFAKDASGNYRFVYSGKDAQAGRNINTIIVQMPLRYVTRNPERDRIVNAWGESWVLKAANKIETIPDDPHLSLWARIRRFFAGAPDAFGAELAKYKRIDTDGLPFADAALSERLDENQLGANNIRLAKPFVRRFAHLGWGFGPSVTALGVKTCFDHGDATVSTYKVYSALETVPAFLRVKKCLFQEMNMPDDSWNPKHLNIPLRRPFEVFIPNVNAVDMDTTGTWPFGRRPEDQVATRFLSIFLDMKAGCGGGPCNVETLGQQSLWDRLPITPKTPPNPLHNDKPFLTRFPYLAEPWTHTASAAPPDDPAHRAAAAYRHATLTGSFADFRAAETALDEAMSGQPSAELVLLRANLEFTLHRLGRAKAELERVPDPLLLAQIALQEGRYEEARRGYEAAPRTWNSLACLAYYQAVTGDAPGADKLYVEAEGLLSAKEMRSLAWIEVQRGILHLDRGRYDAALAHFRAAGRAYPDWWLVEEHIAETLGRMGRTADAVALYRQVIAKTRNPEYVAALANIIRRTDRVAAARLDAEADALYGEQVRLYPEAAGGHVIRHLLARGDAPVALAEENVRLRPNGEAKLLLAKAYWNASRAEDARRVLAEVRRTPYRTPELEAFERQLR